MALYIPEFEEIYPYSYRVDFVGYQFKKEIKIPKNQVHTLNPIITISGHTEGIIFSGEYFAGHWQDYWMIEINGEEIFKGMLIIWDAVIFPLQGEVRGYLLTDRDNNALYTLPRPQTPQYKFVLWGEGGDKIRFAYPIGHPENIYFYLVPNLSVIVTRNIPDLEFVRETKSIFPPEQKINIIKISSEAEREDKFMVLVDGWFYKIFELEPDITASFIKSTDTYSNFKKPNRTQTTETKQTMRDIVKEVDVNLVIGYSSPRYSKHRKTNEL
jgi:hypothetical protein